MEQSRELAILDDGSFYIVGGLAEHIHNLAETAGVSDENAFRVMLTLGFRGVIAGLVTKGQEPPPGAAVFAN